MKKVAVNHEILLKDYETAFPKEWLDMYGFKEAEVPYEDVEFADFENQTFSESLYNQRKEREEADRVYAENKERLTRLSEDLVQSVAGEIIPDLAERKAEFISIHNEVRAYEGKEARKS